MSRRHKKRLSNYGRAFYAMAGPGRLLAAAPLALRARAARAARFSRCAAVEQLVYLSGVRIVSSYTKKALQNLESLLMLAGPGRLFAAARLTPSGPVRLAPPRSTALCAVVELFLFVGSSMSRRHKKRLSNYGRAFYAMAGPGRLLAAAPLALRARAARAARFSRCAAVEQLVYLSGVRIVSSDTKKALQNLESLFMLAGPGRFELPTLRFVAARSIQLSYGPLTGCHGGEGGIRTLEEAINPLLP